MLYLPPIPNYAAYMLIMAVGMAILFLFMFFWEAMKHSDLKDEYSKLTGWSDDQTSKLLDLQNTHNRLLTKLRENGVKVEELK